MCIGAGLGGSDETPVTSYVDDLTINTAASVVPEPASLAVWSGLLAGVVGVRRLRRRAL